MTIINIPLLRCEPKLFRLVIASAFTLIFFESIFILCILHCKKEVYLLETKLPVIAYAKSKWLIMFLRTFGRGRPQHNHFQRLETAKNRPYIIENRLLLAAYAVFSAVSGRQTNLAKISSYFWQPGPGR